MNVLDPPRRAGKRWKASSAVLAVVAAGGLVGATSQQPASAGASTVQVYWSSESRAAGFSPANGNWFSDPQTGLDNTPFKLSRQGDVAVTAAGASATIDVNTTQQYQALLGVGSSLEESTIYNLSRMSVAGRDRALRQLVDPSTGAGFNVIRISFGTSDFTSHDFYSYDDGAVDTGMTRFSIQRDIDYHIVDVLKQAIAINPSIKIFASAWSAPTWMKSNNSLIGGYLNTTYIPQLATYYRKAVQAYVAQGVPIYGMTLGNEPEFGAPDYPSMIVTSDQERQLSKALRTEFTNNALAPKLWAFDHNFSDGMSYASGVVGTSSAHNDAYGSVDGFAFHDYGGDPSAMTDVHNAYPDKDVAMTERAVWGTQGADRIVQYLRNWSTMYEGWVSMLDQNRSPERWTGSPDPSMLIQSPSSPDTFWATPDINIIAQFSKFLKPGARRVNTGYGSTGQVTNVAFLNPDGTLVVVVVNQTTSDQAFTLKVGSEQIAATLPFKTVGTYLWAGANSTTVASGPTAGATTVPKSGLANKCIDVAGDDNGVNEAKVQLWDCISTALDQKWTTYSDGSLRTLGRCLDVIGYGTGNGSKVQLYDCHSTTNQVWEVYGNGYRNPVSGRCLDDPGATTVNGTQLQLLDCSTSVGQIWNGTTQSTGSGTTGAVALTNPGFESGLTGWTESYTGSRSSATVDTDGPHSGTSKATHWSTTSAEQSEWQTKAVANGSYTVTAWVKSGGGQSAVRIFARNYGGADRTAEIGSGSVSSWAQYTISGVVVTNGSIEIGAYSKSTGNQWAGFDDFTLTKTA